MKLFLWAGVPLLLYSFRLGRVLGDSSPADLLTLSPDIVKDEKGASSSPAEVQHQKPGQDLSWRSIYTPVKSCHKELREKQGEFSPPSFPNSFEQNIWCNWTIWAGSRKHIVIYIKGFQSSESCDVSGDKIFFHGVSSLADNTVIYACWQKEVHVFATYAQGVHVVLLLSHSSDLRKEKLVGKYYIFKHRETDTSPTGVVGSSEILIPELSRSVLISLPLSEKEAFLSMWDSVNSNSSASHQTGQVTELSKPSPARREDARVVDLPSFVWQGTSTQHLTPASPSFLSISSIDNREFPCSLETVEKGGHASWGHLSESAVPSDVLSFIPASSPLINTSSPLEEPALPSISWGAFIMNDTQMDGKLMELDYLALGTHSRDLSHSLEATAEEGNKVFSSHSVEEVLSTNFQNGTPVPEGVSRDAPGFKTALLRSPEQNRIRTEMQDDSFLLLSENLEQGWPVTQSDSLGLTFSNNRYMSKWESRTASVPEEKMLDTMRPILESGVEVIDLLQTSREILAPCSLLRGYNGAFSTIENVLPVATEFTTISDVSMNLTTEMLGESQKINSEGQSRYFLDRKTKAELPFFLDEATMAPVVSTEPEFSVFSQDHDLSLQIKPTLPFPVEEVEPSLPHHTEAFFSFAIPNRELTPSYVDPVLSPSMVPTYPFPFVEPGRTLSVPELNYLLSETAIALSLAVPSGLECPCSETAAILQTAKKLENVLSPSDILLELTVSPTTTSNYLANKQTMTAFPLLNEITSSFGLLTENAVKTANSLSSCCHLATSAFKEEHLRLLTVQSSESVEPTMGVPTRSLSAALAAAESENLFATTEMAFTKQQLLEGGNGDNSVSAPEEEDKGAVFLDMVKHLDLLSETEWFSSLSGFTANGQSPQNESVAETSLILVPVTGEEKSVMNYVFISPTALASVLSQTEMQTRAVFPSLLKSEDDTREPIERAKNERAQEPIERAKNERAQEPIERAKYERAQEPSRRAQVRPSAEGQNSALEITVANLNIAETLVKTPPQKNTAKPQTPQPPSDAENKVVSQVPWNETELGFPWLMVYLPDKSCHVTLTDEAGTFSPPTFSSIQANNWCNWTIWAGPNKHILVYIEGFEGKSGCEENQDKILFQGVTSSMENKVAYACRNHGTLVFGTQAVAAHVVFLSKASSQNHGPKHFKGRYYIFEDYPMSTSTDGDMVPEEPAMKSGSRLGVLPYVIHSRHILDFEKMGRIPSNEKSQPVSSKERWNKTNNTSSLEALLGPRVSRYTPVSFSKSAINALDMKEMQVVIPSADEYQSANDTLAGSSKKTVDLGSNDLEDKEKAVLPSTSPYETQKFRTKTKLAAGTTSMSAGVENNGHATIHQRPTYVKDVGRTKFERSSFPSGVSFPQVEQRSPMSPPKSIPEEDRDRDLQLWQSRTEISKKASDALEAQHKEIKEAAGGVRTGGQVIRERNGDRYMAVIDRAGRSRSHGTEPLSINMPDKSTMKAKPQLTTLAHPNVFHVVSSLNIFNSNLMAIATTSHSQVVLPDSVFVFRSEENDSILESQHKPGDVLLEVTFGIEHKGQIPQHRSELEEDLIQSVKKQVQERVKFLSNKVKEIKLKEIKRKERSERKRINDPNLIFTFWLHLVPEEKNISHFIHSQLEGLGGASTGSGKIQQVSVGDVNECTSGIELCGEEAICLNGYGTYFCQCKEEYEDQSLNKSGTLCIRVPPSGLRFLYNYMEIFVGAMVFFIAVIVIVISVLCTVLKKRRTKKDLSYPERGSSNTPATPHSQPVAFDLNNVGNLLTLDPAYLKLRAKSPERVLQLGSSSPEAFRVSVEQSERL